MVFTIHSLVAFFNWQKPVFLFLFPFLCSTVLPAQKLSTFSLENIFEGNVLTGDGFKAWNEVLARNNLYTFQPEFVSRGASLRFAGRNGSSGLNIQLLRLGVARFDSTAQTRKDVRPLLTGTSVRVAWFRKLFETRHWHAHAAPGLSYQLWQVKLVDAGRQRFSLDTLIANPGASPALDFRQSQGGMNLDIQAGIYFKTNRFRKVVDHLVFGGAFGYQHALVSGNQWLANGTQNNFISPDLPALQLHNAYFQMSMAFMFVN